MLEARRLEIVEPLFGLQAAGRLLAEAFAPWVQDLGLVVEEIGDRHAVLRLPWSPRLAREGGSLSGQALMAAETARRLDPESPQFQQLLGQLSQTNHTVKSPPVK